MEERRKGKKKRRSKKRKIPQRIPKAPWVIPDEGGKNGKIRRTGTESSVGRW